MKNLNYRDRVILGILLAFVILIAGFVGLIKPAGESIKEDKETLAVKQEERDGVQAKIDQIPKLKKAIDDTYTDSKKLSDDFIDIDDVNYTYELDQFMRKAAEDSEVRIYEIDMDLVKNDDLKYYYLENEKLAEDFFAAADVNGALQTAYEELAAESIALEDRNVEEVIVTNYGVELRGTRENIWKWMKAVEDYGDARIINKADFKDYTFGTLLKDTASNENGEEEADEAKEASVEFIVSFYSVVEMDKPNTDAE